MVEEFNEQYEDEELREILETSRCFACVGLSANPVRPSYFVGRYLFKRDYKVIPVNPAYSGSQLFGSPVFESIDQIPAEMEVDVVDIFRKPSEVPAVVEAAIDHLPKLRVIWMQIGVAHEETAARARARGLRVIQNRCPKIESQRLFGELRMAGLNTRIISSRL